MSLAVVPVGSEVNRIDFFWDNVRRVESQGEIQPGFCGPFTLEEAMEIAWRVKTFRIECFLEERPSPGDPYGGVFDFNETLEMGQIIPTVGVFDLPFPSELSYAANTQWLTRNYIGYNTVHIFERRSYFINTKPFNRFLYRDGEGFYIGVDFSSDALGIPPYADPVTPGTAQTDFFFTLFGKRTDVYSDEALHGIGYCTITADDYWPYGDLHERRTYSPTTGDPLIPIPGWMP